MKYNGKDIYQKSTVVRENFSEYIDKSVYEKPQFIKRTRNKLVLTDVEMLSQLLGNVKFEAISNTENDGSMTIALKDIDLVENGENFGEAISKLAAAILEYAQEFYSEFELWSRAPNRKAHIPYIFKALILADIEKIGEEIVCQSVKR
ncbi:MAG: hypothetical protein ACRCUS_04860 [Anaerovoracaceae bacterium]